MQKLVRVEALQCPYAGLGPVHGAVLLGRSADGYNCTKVHFLHNQTIQYDVHSLDPHKGLGIEPE